MKHFLMVIAALSCFGCSSLVLKPADFSWPLESVLKADANGVVSEKRFAVSFSIAGLMTSEQGENASAAGATVRLIRNREGYYFITAPSFKNVYVFTAGDGEMKQYKKIEIGDTGMSDPKFNQRDAYIELMNGTAKITLTPNGMTEGGKQ